MSLENPIIRQGKPFEVDEFLVYWDGSRGEERSGRVQSIIGDRLIVRKGKEVKVIRSSEVVGHRLAASWGMGQDDEFHFHGFQSGVTLWAGGKEYRGRVIGIPRSGECLVEFRDNSGGYRVVEMFQDELVLHRRVNSGRRNARRPDDEADET